MEVELCLTWLLAVPITVYLTDMHILPMCFMCNLPQLTTVACDMTALTWFGEIDKTATQLTMIMTADTVFVYQPIKTLRVANVV
jgi:hypothetical protein